jgi:hydrogenase-4 component B
LSVQSPSAFGQMSPTLVMLGLLMLLALVPLAMWILRVNRRLRVSDSWGCGRAGQTARMEYTATSFAEPLRRVFAELYRPTKELTVEFHPDSKYFVQSIAYKSEIAPLFERLLYDPFLRLMQFAARQVQHLQAGSLHLYLVYVTVILIILLLAARWF